MNVKVLKSEKTQENQMKLTIEVGADDFGAAVQQAYQKTVGRFNIPGFRKGKAPRKVIENMYGAGVFFEEAFEIAVPKAYDAAIEAQGLYPVSRPQLDVESIEAGAPLVFTAEFFVKPDVILGQYKGIECKKPDDTVSEEAIEAEIKRAQDKVARFEVVERPVANGDTVMLDYSGSVDGVKFDGGTAEGQTLVIGSGSFIPGFEEQVIGVAVGEEKDITVTFPAEYHAPELAGKEAVFAIKVHEVKEKQMPELDDEFAKDVSEFDTLDAYKADIRAKLQETATKRAADELENTLIEKAAENAQIAVPAPMVETQIDYMLRDMEMRMSMQGIRMQDFLQYTGQTSEQLREQYKVSAEKRVRTELTLEAIKNAENITVTDEEIDAEIVSYAAQQKQELDAFKAKLSPADRDYFKQMAEIKKIIDLIKESAVYA